ncbi:MAG: hypothetical protein OXJ53_19220 [Gammaproteobacteria bacterium]|nr:hypothetical protein [Gammaproteobacteria bacterium]
MPTRKMTLGGEVVNAAPFHRAELNLALQLAVPLAMKYMDGKSLDELSAEIDAEIDHSPDTGLLDAMETVGKVASYAAISIVGGSDHLAHLVKDYG